MAATTDLSGATENLSGNKYVTQTLMTPENVKAKVAAIAVGATQDTTHELSAMQGLSSGKSFPLKPGNAGQTFMQPEGEELSAKQVTGILNRVLPGITGALIAGTAQTEKTSKDIAAISGVVLRPLTRSLDKISATLAGVTEPLIAWLNTQNGQEVNTQNEQEGGRRRRRRQTKRRQTKRRRMTRR